jgi:CheY-like chemotaxis protein
MTTQQWVDAVLRLVGYLVSWPVVTVTIVVMLRKRIIATLSALSERARRASLGPVSVEFDQTAVEALQDTARQAAQEFGTDPAKLADFLAEQITKMAESSGTRQDKEPFTGNRVLWTDDNIGHHLFEMRYLERLGVELETAATTEEALNALDGRAFDLVISDMHRIEDGVDEPQAGLKLLRAMRSRRRIPLTFYTSNAVLLRANPEIAAYGAVATDTANELFDEVRRMLASRRLGDGPQRLVPGQRHTPEGG